MTAAPSARTLQRQVNIKDWGDIEAGTELMSRLMGEVVRPAVLESRPDFDIADLEGILTVFLQKIVPRQRFHNVWHFVRDFLRYLEQRDVESIQIVDSGGDVPEMAQRAKAEAIEAILVAETLLGQVELSGEQSDHVRRIFGATSAEQLASNLRQLREYLAAHELKIDRSVKSSVNAFTLRGEITLLDRFFTIPAKNRYRTIVHEAVHAVFSSPDYAYSTERLITTLPPRTAARNPDSYVWLILGLLEGNTEPTGLVQDEIPGELPPAAAARVTKVIGLTARYLVNLQSLIEQAQEDLGRSLIEKRPPGQNTLFVLQEIRKISANPAQWEPSNVTEKTVTLLGAVSKTFLYLYGGLTAPVRIRTDESLPGPQWRREGTGQVHLTLPSALVATLPLDLAVRSYATDLLAAKSNAKIYLDLLAALSTNPNLLDRAAYGE